METRPIHECHTLPGIFLAETKFSGSEVFHSVEHGKTSKGVGKYVLHCNAHLDIVELQLRTKGVLKGNTSRTSRRQPAERRVIRLSSSLGPHLRTDALARWSKEA